MLAPMNAVTFQLGKPQMTMLPKKPIIARQMPKIWRPVDTMSLHFLR